MGAVVYTKDKAGNLVSCPGCESTDVRYSDSHHILDLWNLMFQKHSLRCRSCRLRFYAETDEAKNMMWVK